MNIEDLTVKQIKEIVPLYGDRIINTDIHQTDNSAWEIGKVYLIRTVTLYDTGRLVQVTDQEKEEINL